MSLGHDTDNGDEPVEDGAGIEVEVDKAGNDVVGIELGVLEPSLLEL